LIDNLDIGSKGWEFELAVTSASSYLSKKGETGRNSQSRVKTPSIKFAMQRPWRGRRERLRNQGGREDANVDSNWKKKKKGKIGGFMTPRVSRRIDLSAGDATVDRKLAIHPIHPVII
jgi:hypothetical protein